MGVHFEYQGVHFELPDGTTPEIAKQKILTHLGKTTPQAPTEPITKSEENSTLKNVLLENPLTAIGEAGLSMVSGTPEFLLSSASKVGSLLQGKTSKADLEEAGKDVPAWAKAITYEPRGEMGKGLVQAMGEGMAAVGEGLAAPGAGIPAAIGAAISGEGQSGAQRRFKERYEQISPITRTLFEAGLGAKGIKDTYTGFKKQAQARKDLEQLKALEEAKKAKQQPPQQPADGALPKLPEEQLLVPGTTGEELVFPKTEEAPLPAIPDELKPLSEQYPKEIPIGTIEEGGAWSNTPGAPKLEPPVLTRDLLSLEDQIPKDLTVPDTERLATRHDIPTDEFPLRQEVLQQPEIVDTITKFREEASRLEQQASNGLGFWKKQAQEKLAKLQDEFLAGMRQLGIDNPQEALGLQKLYDSGNGTKLPVERTFDGRSPLGGVGKRQGGALDLSAFREGLDDLNTSLSKLTDRVAPYLTNVTILRNSDNTPKVYLHGTKNNFDPREISAKGDLGIHLGDSATAAHARISPNLSYIGSTPQGVVKPAGWEKTSGNDFYSDPKNLKPETRMMPYIIKSTPERVVKVGRDVNDWTSPINVISLLKREGILPQNAYMTETGYFKEPSIQTLRADLVKMGIDAIEYPNKYESINAAPNDPRSIVVLNKNALVPLSDAIADNTPTGGTGKKGFRQGGAINFDFGKKTKTQTFDEFKDYLDNLAGYVTDVDTARQMFDQKYPTETKAAKVKEAVSDIPGIKDSEGFNKYESRPVLDDPLGENSVKRMEAVGSMDLPEPVGGLSKTVLSAGRLQSWNKASPLVHEGTQFITSVKDTYRIASAEAMSSVNKLTMKMERTIQALGLGKESWKDAAEVFRIRREHEFDATFDPSTVLSGSKLELFKQIDSVIKDLWPKINARRKLLDPKAQDLPQLPYYFTSFFTGDWTIPVFDKTTGQFLFNLRETTRGAANKAKEWVDSQPDFSARDVRLQKQTHYSNAKIDAASDFQTMVDTFGTSDPAALQAMQRLAASGNRSSFNTAGMPNRFLNKEGRVGSLGDKPWRSEKENYYDNKKAFERYVEGANEWLANTQISKFAENMQKSKAIDAPNAKAFIQDYADYVTGRKETSSNAIGNLATSISHSMGGSGTAGMTIARKWANANTALFIGYYSARAGLQNSVQWLQATAPKLTQLGLQEGYQGNAPAAIVLGMFRGTRDAIGHWAGGDLDLATMKRVKQDSLAFKEANHVVDAHLVESQGMFKNAWASTAYDLVANKSVAATEQLSRSVAFSIYQAYLESAGISKAKAMDMAKNLTHETMVNYESYAKPQMFGATGPIGEMAGRLQTYKMNSVTQFYEYASKMKKTDPTSWAPIAVALGMNVALAGALGLIGMDVAELMWQGLQAADRSFGTQNQWIQENSVKRYIYENFNPHVSMGVLSTTLGVSASGAFAQNLVGDEPLKSIVPIFGGAVDQITAPFKILGGSSDSSMAQGLNAIAPASAKPYVEQAFNTVEHPDGQKQVISPNTGKTSWKGENQGYKTTAGLIHPIMTNLQTLERGQYAMDSKFHHEFNKDILDSQKAIEDSVQKQVIDWFKAQVQGTDAELQRTKLESKLIQYLDAGGDVETLTQHISTQLEHLGIGDELISEVSKEIQMAKRKQAQHAADTFNRRQAR